MNNKNNISPEERIKSINKLQKILVENDNESNEFGLNVEEQCRNTAIIVVDEIGLYQFDDEERITNGLQRIAQLYEKTPVVESENFRNLFLSFAEDLRVILIMIADRVNLLRQIKDTKNIEGQKRVSEEAAYLYAPLAHKLGLYTLKRELEDLSLKYLEHDAYYMIKEKLNATKKTRDAYIERFIQPVKKQLEETGLHFHIKGRTKSIHSIWQKMKKQRCGFEGIYDLFAIRIIIESHSEDENGNEIPLKKILSTEKKQCWLAYSVVTDMYQPNPKRLRDWLSVPKSNGYESLHITVLGPENKWVEVQIRTERMDEIAEKGLAAHWRYKGLKGETGLDEWLNNIRGALETGDGIQLMDQMKMDLYEDEVFVFTPKGDLYKFPKGATVLDFAYHIHSNVGNKCVGAKINDRNVNLKEELKSGDQVEILTNNNQKPNIAWLNIAKTSRAKSKIKLALKETQIKEGAMAKELLQRKFKNHKIEYEDNILSMLIKKMGFKEVSEFYKQVANESIDVNQIMEKYVDLQKYLANPSSQQGPAQSAEDFHYKNPDDDITHQTEDVLTIDKNLSGLDYKLAKCCHPIYGDSIFGFVTAGGGVKIHRTDCPNAKDLRMRYGYRIVKARWSGKGSSQYVITLRVIGNDDISIVNNITNVISKEEHLALRSININSNDGLFSGNLEVRLDDTSKLETLIKRLQTIKGVKQVTRI